MKPDLRSLLHASTLEEPRAGQEQDKSLQSVAVRRIVQRIRQVMTRRDLAIPLTGSQAVVDPNTIAEYLDGSLPLDRAAEIEELCLVADKYLAEVAGCREVLSETSRASRKTADAESPSPAAFRRMYELPIGPAGRAVQGHGPVRQTQGQFRRRRWAMAAAVLAMACLLLVVWQFPVLVPGLQPTDQKHEAGDNEADAAFVAKESPPTNEQEKPREIAAGQLGNIGLSAGLLWRLKGKNWRPFPSDAVVSIDDELLSLPGYQNEIRLESGARLRLLGNLPPFPILQEWGIGGAGPQGILESAVTLRSTPGIDLDLLLSRGRITVANAKPQGEARIRIRFGEETWDLTLPQPGSEAALQLRHSYPPGFQGESGGEEPVAEVHLLALHGEVHLQIRYDSYSLHGAPGPAEFSWNNVGAMSRRPKELQQLPAWAESPARLAGPTVTEEMREALANLQARLEAHHANPVASLLKEGLNQPAPASRVLAVYGLGAVDKLGELVSVLGDEKQQAEVRRAAIIAIQHWMSREAENEQRLSEALKKKYSSATAEIVLHLLHGFSQAQLQQPAVYASLISYLQHVDLPVRELAYNHLRSLVPTGRNVSYDPASGPAQRRAAAGEWKKLIPEGSVPKK
jgi:hypothetical protein